jgi:hypothetical protein
MGRYQYSNRQTTIDCNQISVKFLKDNGFFKVDSRWGVLNWSRGSEIITSLNFEVSMTDGDEFIRFDKKQTIQLESTTPYFGGRRWWFVCSAIKNNRLCRRRVGILYLSQNLIFGCRHCLDLTYQCCKESHKHDWVFKKIGVDPKAGRRLLLEPRKAS